MATRGKGQRKPDRAVSQATLLRRDRELRRRLAESEMRRTEAEQTLEAIRTGAVDAVVVSSGPGHDQIYTLQGAERSYRLLVETVNAGALTLGLDGMVQYANQQAAALLGVRLEQILGGVLDPFIAPEDLEHFHTLFDESRRGKAAGEVTLLGTRGLVPVQLAARRLDEAEHPVICVVVTDLTERHLIEQALRRANETLEARVAERTAALQAALADKDALLREVHHRVKNNLQMLCDLMYLQMEAMPDRDQHQDLQDAYGRIYAIARLHEQLHQAMQGGRIHLGEYLGRLVDGFTRLHAPVRTTLEAANVDVLLDLDRSIHVGLIVNELLTNAVKHAFRAGSRGEVTVAVCAAGSQIQLQVRDNGRGLPEDIDPEQATSLGLRTVHILASRLKARMRVTRNSGTSFTLTFPAEGDPPLDPEASSS
jgi:PAS domain S-box-containing protein